MTEAKRNTEINQRLANLFESNLQLLEDGAAGFMNAARKPAIEAFRRQGIPDFKTENYKYTDMSKIFANENHRRVFAYEDINVNLHELFQCDVPELDTYLVMVTNGWYYTENQQLADLPKGVIITSLRKAAVDYPELVERYYGKMADPEKDPLTALNTAFAQDGVFIYVPNCPEVYWMIGRKTTMVVAVESTMARLTSAVPSMAAARTPAPSALRR